PAHRLRNNAEPRFRGMLSERGAAGVPGRRDSGGVRVRTHPRGVSETTGTNRSGGAEYGNLAEAVAPRPGSLWFIARGLLSLVLPQLLLHREGKQRACDQLCRGAQDTRARADLAAAPGDLGQGSQATGLHPRANGHCFVMPNGLIPGTWRSLMTGTAARGGSEHSARG